MLLFMSIKGYPGILVRMITAFRAVLSACFYIMGFQCYVYDISVSSSCVCGWEISPMSIHGSDMYLVDGSLIGSVIYAK